MTGTAGRGYEVERMRSLALPLAAALLGASGPAAAGPAVTLNGVPIDGVTGQRFESCTVVIDERGDIHIQAKGYAVRTSGGEPSRAAAAPAAQPGAPERLSRRYFVATEQTTPGPQYDLAVFVNAQWVREVKAAERQAVLEITKYLRPGPNKITLAATKRIVGDRLAATPDARLKAVVGEGNAGGDHVMIDVPLAEMVRTAAELDDRSEEFVIEAR